MDEPAKPSAPPSAARPRPQSRPDLAVDLGPPPRPCRSSIARPRARFWAQPTDEKVPSTKTPEAALRRRRSAPPRALPVPVRPETTGPDPPEELTPHAPPRNRQAALRLPAPCPKKHGLRTGRPCSPRRRPPALRALPKSRLPATFPRQPSSQLQRRGDWRRPGPSVGPPSRADVAIVLAGPFFLRLGREHGRAAFFPFFIHRRRDPPGVARPSTPAATWGWERCSAKSVLSCRS